MTKYNVLIIEDEPKDYERLRNRMETISQGLSDQKIMLHIDGIRCWETSRETYLDVFEQQTIDIILLDYELTWKDGFQGNGIQVLDDIAENVKGQFPYIIYTSGRFETDINASNGIACADNGRKFQYHQVPKPTLFNDQKSDYIIDVIQKALPNIEGRISLNLIDYPFNIETHKYAPEYSIQALLSDEDFEKKPKTPSTYYENQIIRENQIIAMLAKKNELYGLLHIRENEIQLSIVDMGVNNPTLAEVQARFMESRIPLQKGTSILFNPTFIEKKRYRVKTYAFIPAKSLSQGMIYRFIQRKSREIQKDANFVPFYGVFKKLVTN